MKETHVTREAYRRVTGAEHRLQISQLVKGTPSEIFQAWLLPNVAKKWLCPENCRLESHTAHPVVRGEYRSSMICAEELHTNFGRYLEIVPEEKIVFTHQWEEAHPVETRVTVWFKQAYGGTEVVLHHEGFQDPEETRGHREGWRSTLRNLARLYES